MEKAEYLLEIIKGRMSIRRFKPAPIKKEHLNFILEAAWSNKFRNY